MRRTWTVRKEVDRTHYTWRGYTFDRLDDGSWYYEDDKVIIRFHKRKNATRPFVCQCTVGGDHHNDYFNECFTVQWGLKDLLDRGLIDF